jgi:hypothetical protein
MIIRSAQPPGAGAALGGAPECVPDADPLLARAAQAFAVEFAAGRVPLVRDPRPAACRPAACPAGAARTWPRSTARRRACPSNIGLRSLRFGRLPDGTARRAARNIRLIWHPSWAVNWGRCSEPKWLICYRLIPETDSPQHNWLLAKCSPKP